MGSAALDRGRGSSFVRPYGATNAFFNPFPDSYITRQIDIAMTRRSMDISHVPA